MGKLWVYDGTAWKEGIPSVSRETGYVPGKSLYRRPTTSTWSLVWQRDQTPPPAPIISATMINGTRNRFKIDLTTPATSKKFTRVVVKVGINKWSSGPTANDGTFYTEELNGEQWSSWLTSSLVADNTIEPGESASKEFPATYQPNLNLPLNTPINISAWVQDTNLNWSPAATLTVRTLKATDPPAGMQLFSTAIYQSSFDTWSVNKSYYILRDEYKKSALVAAAKKTWVGQYGPNLYGWQGGAEGYMQYMCYGNRIREVVNQAQGIAGVRWAFVRRGYNGPSGEDPASGSGPANSVTLRTYGLSSSDVPAAGSTSHLTGGVNNYADVPVTIALNETVYVNLPEKIWSQFIDGKGTAKGLAFYSNSYRLPSNTDPLNPSFTLVGSWGTLRKGSRGGIVLVDWYGYTNPWPEATYGHPQFRPIGWTGAVPF